MNDRVIATDDGELTNVLPDMFGGHTPDEYMLKAEMPEVEKSDWSVNDENDAAYIKNRTHWTDDDGTVHKIDEKYLPDVGVRSWNDLTDKPFDSTTTTILNNYSLDGSSSERSTLGAAFSRYEVNVGSIGFDIGDTVTVTWSGEKYVLKAYDAGEGIAAVGNDAYASGGEDTGEPFAIGYMSPSLIIVTPDSDVVVSVNVETVKKMSGKYVEGMGWSEVTKSYTDTLTWDGVLSDDDIIKTIGGYTLGYHRVSDEVPSLEQLSAGGICTVYQESEFKTIEFTSDEVEDRSSEGAITAGAVAVICRDNVTIDGATFPKAGIYFMSAPDVYISGFKVNGYQFEVVTETIHPIDKKYLPSRCGLPMLCLTVDGDSWKVTSDTEVADALEILGQTDFVTVICAVKYEGKTNYATLQSIEYNAENAFYVLKFSWYDGDFYVRVSREFGYAIPME